MVSSNGGQPVTVSSRRIGEDAIVVTVRGELDLHSAPELENSLRQMTDGSVAVLVIDLTDVPFIASRGLATLVSAAHQGRAHGVRVRVVSTARAVLRVLEVTETTDLLGLAASVPEALAG